MMGNNIRIQNGFFDDYDRCNCDRRCLRCGKLKRDKNIFSPLGRFNEGPTCINNTHSSSLMVEVCKC